VAARGRRRRCRSGCRCAGRSGSVRFGSVTWSQVLGSCRVWLVGIGCGALSLGVGLVLVGPRTRLGAAAVTIAISSTSLCQATQGCFLRGFGWLVVGWGVVREWLLRRAGGSGCDPVALD